MTNVNDKKNTFLRFDLWAILGLLFITVLFNYRIALFAELPLDSDTLLFFYPLRALHSDPFVGLWNPYEFCGMPRDANPQSQLLYPPNGLFSLVPTYIGYAAMLIGHLWLGAALMYALIRTLKISRPSAFFGAVVFLVSTFWRCKITNLGLLEGIAWLPGVLLFTLQSFDRHTIRNAVIASFFLALTILCGVPHTVIYGSVMLVLISLGYLWYQAGKWTIIALSLGITFFLSIAITTGVWLPAVLYSTETQRVQLELQDALAGSLGWNEIWRVFLGGLSQPKISRHEPWEGTCYIAMTALFILPLGWRTIPKALRLGLIAAFLFAFFCTLGSSGFLFPFLFHYFPGWSFLNLPNRSLLMAAIVLPIFAAYGLDALCEWKPQQSRWQVYLPLTTSVICIMVIFGSIMFMKVNAFQAVGHPELTNIFNIYDPSNEVMVFFTIVFWLNLFCVTLFIYWKRTIGFNRFSLLFVIMACAQSALYSPRLFLETTPHDWMDAPKTIAYVKEQIKDHPNTRVVGYAPFMDADDDVRSNWVRYLDMHRLPDVYKLHEVQGYDPMYPKRYGELLEALSGRKQNSDRTRILRLNKLSKPMLDMLNVGYVIGHPDQHLQYAGGVILDKPGEIGTKLKEPLEVEEISMRWLLDRAEFYPQNLKIGQIKLQRDGFTLDETLPIQTGVQIANTILQVHGKHVMHRPAPIFRWFPIPTRDGYQRVHQFRYTYKFKKPETIDNISIEMIDTHHQPYPRMVIQQIDLHTTNHKGLEKVDADTELPIFRNLDARKTNAYLTTETVYYKSVEEIADTLKVLQDDDPLPVFRSEETLLHPGMGMGSQLPDTRKTSMKPVSSNPRYEIESITRSNSDRFDIKLNVEAPAYLVIQENYSPNWSIEGLDYNRPELVNHTFMAALVGPKWISFSLVYTPWAYYIGCTVGTTFLLIALGLCYYFWNEKHCEK